MNFPNISMNGDRSAFRWTTEEDKQELARVSLCPSNWTHAARATRVIVFDFVHPFRTVQEPTSTCIPAVAKLINAPFACVSTTEEHPDGRRADMAVGDKLYALRLISHRLGLNADDVLQLIKSFPSIEPEEAGNSAFGIRSPRHGPRVECYLCLFTRCVSHSCALGALQGNIFRKEELDSIKEILGRLHTFDALNLGNDAINDGSECTSQFYPLKEYECSRIVRY